MTLGGRYALRGRIAAGGMGEVSRAFDTVLHRDVAVKILHPALASDPGFVERFRQEARAAAALTHPGIVAIYDWGSVDGRPYMVMELVEGQSLRAVLAQNGPLRPAQVAEVMRGVLAALGAAHSSGIVHRDVKPENILLTSDGRVKVTDFGLARAFADGQATAGLVSGTVRYLSPEQVRGEPADPRSDLYAVGIVAFELLTGYVPFTGETPIAIATRHLHERVPPPSMRAPGIPAGLDSWVASMTERDREMRPVDAREAAADLAAEAAALAPAPALATLVRAAAATEPVDADRADTVVVRRGAKTPEPLASGEAARPRPRPRRWFLSFLALALATVGIGVRTYLLPGTAVVPRVLGTSVSEATLRLEDAGFDVIVDDPVQSETIAVGDVVRVRPGVGETVERGASVTIVPSAGPAPVAVPDVSGSSLADATATLRSARLEVGEVTEANDPDAPRGTVLRQDPSGGEAAPGTEIDLVLSAGPAPIPVPSVLGLTRAQAERELEGWRVVVSTAYSDEVPSGGVFAQSPDPGKELAPGSRVKITVSLGPERFPVPDLVGLTTAEATSLLEDLGLVAAPLPVPGSQGDEVVSQLPAAGTVVRVGQTVTFYFA